MTDTITLTDRTMVVTSTNGVRFRARIVTKGDRYGLDMRLTWESDDDGVEFYDTRYPHTEFGQFVSRYYIETILGNDGLGLGDRHGLDLCGYVDDWKIDARAMNIVRAWLRLEVER